MELNLDNFEGISLKQMGKIRLMKRIDKKYIIPFMSLPEILSKLSKDYYIQEIDGKRTFQYATLYYDTPTYDMYHSHQNGKLCRLKIRTREYIDSNLCFLEIKTKSNKGVTKKIRIPNQDLNCIKEQEPSTFIHLNTPYDIGKIEAKVNTFYTRITLVNKAKTERVTVDYNLCFKHLVTEHKVKLPNLSVIEIKKEQSTFSPIEIYLDEMRIRPQGMSKYCLGTALTDPHVKLNQIKTKIRTINKITDIIHE